jgi:hypothetical protein
MFCDIRMGGEPRWHFSRTKDWNMLVPDMIRNCVVFVGRTVTKGSRVEDSLGGTAFVVGVPGKRPNRTFLYLVTARHVAQELSLGNPLARMNTKSGGVLRVCGGDINWWYHPAAPKEVDVAVTPFNPPIEVAEFTYIPVSEFLTDDLAEDRGIGAGDEVFLTGLFTKLEGGAKNLPIVRVGNVAMMPPPGELLPNTRIGDWVGDAEVYLIETRSTGGLSGSPVFVRETVGSMGTVKGVGKAASRERQTILQMHGGFLLMGLVHGHWSIAARQRNEVRIRTVKSTEEDAVNLGIAVVSPAKKILEVLNQPGLVEQRRQIEEAAQAEEGTTEPDSSLNPVPPRRVRKSMNRDNATPAPSRSRRRREGT